MKYYVISEQDLYEILIDLENSLFANLERLEVTDDKEHEEEEECTSIVTDGGVVISDDCPDDLPF